MLSVSILATGVHCCGVGAPYSPDITLNSNSVSRLFLFDLFFLGFFLLPVLPQWHIAANAKYRFLFCTSTFQFLYSNRSLDQQACSAYRLNHSNVSYE